MERVVASGSGWTEGMKLFSDYLTDAASENLLVMYSDPFGAALPNGVVFPGTTHSVAIPYRRIVLDALKMNCRTILLAHNHPSGDLRPSRADVEQTRMLARTLGPLNVQLADHCIVGSGGSFSFRDHGLI